MLYNLFRFTLLFFVFLSLGINTGYAQFKMALELENVTDNEIQIVLKKGDIYETINPDDNRQNLVLIKDYSFTIPPRSTISKIVEAYCTTQHRSPPTDNEPMRITPLRHGIEFNTQEELWDRIQQFQNVRY